MKKVLVFSIVCLCFLASGVFAAGTVDINTASLAQLDTLTGIGPAYAQRIIDGRPYSSVNDLDRVKGIGPATLQKIKDQGLACVNCGTTQTATPPAQSSSQTQNNVAGEPTGSTPTATTTATATTTPTPGVIYPSGVVINEIMANPQGADETDEWIELKNTNNSDVDLSGWQLQDRAGTITTYTIPSITKIMAGGFLVFRRPDTKIMLNNDGDGVNLLTPDGKTIDSVGFLNAPLGQSYNKTSPDWAWSTTITPGAVNIITGVKVTAKTTPTTTKALPKAQKSDNNGNIKAEDLTAGLSQAIPAGTNPWPMFLIVLGSTIILAIIVLLIKTRFLKPNN